MSKSTTYRVAVYLVGCMGFGLGCAAGQPHAERSAAVPEAVTAPAPAAVGEAPECVDDKDQAVECLSDADCCQGFVCGKDPERSHRVSYCIFGG